jgi:hypothetical protein
MPRYYSPSRSRSRSTSSSRPTRPPSAGGRSNKESLFKASLAFLGSIVLATLCANRFWPKGILHGDKEEWEVEEIKHVKRRLHDERDRMRDHAYGGLQPQHRTRYADERRSGNRVVYYEDGPPERSSSRRVDSRASYNDRSLVHVDREYDRERDYVERRRSRRRPESMDQYEDTALRYRGEPDRRERRRQSGYVEEYDEDPRTDRDYREYREPYDRRPEHQPTHQPRYAYEDRRSLDQRPDGWARSGDSESDRRSMYERRRRYSADDRDEHPPPRRSDPSYVFDDRRARRAQNRQEEDEYSR